MNARTRRDEILRMARASGLTGVEELSQTFEVTPSTIRRDLSQLTQSGQLARTYGGAIAIGAAGEMTLTQRNVEAFSAKRAIGRWASREVKVSEQVFLDAGTTVGALAHELFLRGPLTVVTTGLTALTQLDGAKDIVLISTGGTYRPMSEAFVGAIAESALGTMTFDRVFLGTDGVDPEFGVCEATAEQSRLKSILVSRSREVYVLAHGNKVGARPFHSWTPLKGSWHLVTDASADAQVLEQFRTAGVDVVVVDENEEISK